MKRNALLIHTACLSLLGCPPALLAQNAPTSSSSSSAAPITQLISDAPAGGGAEPARFSADAKWQIAGYNDEEIVYTIIITSQDSRIIHCNSELHGFYFDNGLKRSISDRQGTTIFPGKQASVGHWLGMDEKSGATYKVSCRPM